MAQIEAAVPQVYMPGGSTGQPNIRQANPSGTVNDGDIVVYSGSDIATAATNVASGIVGIAIMLSTKNYGGSINAQPSPTFAFGFTQEGDPGYPADASQTMYATLGAPASLEINLAADCGWVSGGTQQANVGTAVGLLIDPSTGFFVADPSQSNKVAFISEKIFGPSAGDVGDLGGRVLITFDSAALVN